MPPTESDLGSSSEDTLDLQLPPEFSALFAEGHGQQTPPDEPAAGPLLDQLAGWGRPTPPPGRSSSSPSGRTAISTGSPAG